MEAVTRNECLITNRDVCCNHHKITPKPQEPVPNGKLVTLAAQQEIPLPCHRTHQRHIDLFSNTVKTTGTHHKTSSADGCAKIHPQVHMHSKHPLTFKLWMMGGGRALNTGALHDASPSVNPGWGRQPTHWTGRSWDCTHPPISHQLGRSGAGPTKWTLGFK